MSEKTFDFPAPRPWRIDGQAIRDREGYVVMSAFTPASMETRKLIVDAVNSKTEADTPKPLPFGMADARDEASRRYQETHQEFWAGLADLLADAAALEEYHANDRAEILRLRAALNGFADEWEKYAEEENMRAPAWASCFRSFARDCRKAALGGEE